MIQSRKPHTQGLIKNHIYYINNLILNLDLDIISHISTNGK